MDSMLWRINPKVEAANQCIEEETHNNPDKNWQLAYQIFDFTQNKRITTPSTIATGAHFRIKAYK